jgi:hypothetical protein
MLDSSFSQITVMEEYFLSKYLWKKTNRAPLKIYWCETAIKNLHIGEEVILDN